MRLPFPDSGTDLCCLKGAGPNLQSMNRRTYLAAVVGASASLAGCADVLGDEDYDVGMTANAFEPEELTVSVGETVVWRNTSSRGHTVTAYESAIPEEAEYFASGGFESEAEARAEWDTTGETGMLGPGEEYEYTFDVPGTYGYVCLPHEDPAAMVGWIHVEE